MEFNNEVFRERFAKLRERSEKSQEELARLLGVTQQSLSRYEKGQRQPSVDFIVKAAAFFGVSTDYLLGLSEIQSMDADIQTVCKATGLDEGTIIEMKERAEASTRFSRTLHNLLCETSDTNFKGLSVMELISYYFFADSLLEFSAQTVMNLWKFPISSFTVKRASTGP